MGGERKIRDGRDSYVEDPEPFLAAPTGGSLGEAPLAGEKIPI
jgi:hypothetical protein